jgi:hypothetical protein
MGQTILIALAWPFSRARSVPSAMCEQALIHQKGKAVNSRKFLRGASEKEL